MLISVIVCTFNRCDSLKNTLESLLKQENKGFNYEIIIVDNNSKDATKQIIEVNKIRFNGKLKYILEARQGLPYARNAGIREAKGELLAFTDDDCIVEKNWLKRINEIFKERNIDMVGGKVLPIYDSEKPTWFIEDLFKSPIVKYDLGDKYIENKDVVILTVGANVSFRKSALAKFGAFSVNHGLRSDDSELSYRWHRKGARISYSPDIIVFHYTNPTRLKKTYFRKWYFLCGKNNSVVFKDKFKSHRQFFNVPFWIYKDLIFQILKFLKSLSLFDKYKFSKEIWIWYNLGLIFGLQGLKTKFENLR